MCKTTTPTSRHLDDLIKVFPSCTPRTGSKQMKIRVFDEKHLLNDTNTSTATLKEELESFFMAMSQTPGLNTTIKENLASFSFELIYSDRYSTATERDRFGMMDFPIYLESTSGSTALTDSEAEEMLLQHRIPKQTKVRKQTDENSTTTTFVKDAKEKGYTYEAVSEALASENVLGLGIPGTYFIDKSQQYCRKLGIIKIDRIIEMIPSANRPPRFFHVLKHEMGHNVRISPCR